MSDEKKEGEVQAPALVELRITYDPKTGGVSLNGPIKETMFCLGLLEMGKVSLLEFRHQEMVKAGATLKSPRLLVPANGHIPKP